MNPTNFGSGSKFIIIKTKRERRKGKKRTIRHKRFEYIKKGKWLSNRGKRNKGGKRW